jgi:glycosyltransferase 2 family protein
LKKHLITLLKYALPLGIIGWLVYQVEPAQALQIVREEKNWPSLLAGFLLTFVALALGFVRWYFLVRGLGLPFRLADAFRLGFLGYLLTFVSGGSVGGDLFKAVFVAHEHPGRRAEAVATVAIDRVVGMVALLLMTSTAILLAAPLHAPPVVKAICDVTLLVTSIGLLLLTLLLVPPHTGKWLVAVFKRVPKLGELLAQLAGAVLVYRRMPRMLALVLAISVTSHVLLVFSLYLIAISVLNHAPSLGEHFIIVPLSMVAGALPLTPGGLGTFELAMDQLYRTVPEVLTDKGVLVALGYRLMTILIAVIGGVYYMASRRQVDQLLDEAEHQHSDPSPAAEDSPPQHLVQLHDHRRTAVDH